VPADALDDLRAEDPVAAVELHYPPVRVSALPRVGVVGECSTDGFYDTEITPGIPRIFYADDVAETRVRFTVLHELGHHLFVNDAAALLDDLDQVGGSAKGAAAAEEKVCHRFAGQVLVDDRLLNDVIGDGRLGPKHIVEIRERSNASWDATAVRAAERINGPGAVVLIRDPGLISFCAAAHIESPWWGRGSPVDPAGPLARSLRADQTAVPDTYRFGLSFARRLFCDTFKVHDRLAVAVLTQKASDSHFEILEELEPAWREREQFCDWCNGERSVGWCDRCKGRYCQDCERCGCGRPIKNPICPSCGLLKATRPGARVCRDCEADTL